MGAKFLSFEELKGYGVSTGRRHIDRLEARGLFPKRVHLSPGRIVWLAAEIEAHVKAKISARQDL